MRGKASGMRKAVVVALLSLTTTLSSAQTPALEVEAGAIPAGFSDQFYPAWQHGTNKDALNRGIAFTVPQIDVLADFHGDLTDPKLVLYIGGNYFFILPPLIKEFETEHPEYKGRIYWETIPPGMLVNQIKSGGTITSGNMTWTIKGDAYFSGLNAVKGLIEQGLLTAPAVPYVTNTLTIMVPKGNPGHVVGLADLGRPDLTLVMPNPQFEGIAKQIKTSLAKVGGEELVKTVYENKVADGSSRLTFIHHRQTPLLLIQGEAQAGVTWQSEAMFQEEIGNPISHVDIPDSENSSEIYAGAVIKGAPHPEAAKVWLEFIHSPPALKIFGHYGIRAYEQY